MSKEKIEQGFVKEINKPSKKNKSTKNGQKRIQKLGKSLKKVSKQLTTAVKKRSRVISKILAKKIKVTKIENKKVIAALKVSDVVVKYLKAKSILISKKATPVKVYLAQKLHLPRIVQILSGKMLSQFILKICKGDENKREQILQILAS